MIQLLAGRFQKTIALLLTLLFYCEFVFGGIYIPVNQYRYEASFQYDRQYYDWSLSKQDFAAETRLPEVVNVDDTSHAKADPVNQLLDSTAEPNTDIEFSGGPTQPEMQAFQSVNSNNMVDLFTGDFNYNIPLMDVGGYPVNIAYRSGISMDQEASWVGLGWNINPGTVTRNMRGLPDDFNGATDSITKTTSIKENKTVGVTTGADIELTGLPLNLGVSFGVFNNTYRGWGMESGLNASIRAGNSSKGSLSGGLGISITNNTQNGVTIQPSLSVGIQSNEAKDEGGLSGSLSLSGSYNSRAGLKSLNFSTGVRAYKTDTKTIYLGKYGSFKTGKGFGTSASYSTSISFASQSYTPTISMPYTSTQYSFTSKVGLEFVVLHPSFFLNGYVSNQKILPEDQVSKLPAYGYLHYQTGAKNESALLDFNREKEIPYSEQPPVPNIAIPSYTYDVFSISGEGTGGMFRPYRSDIGYIHDHYMKTKDQSGALSVDVGIGNLVHAGMDLNFNSAYTQTGMWNSNNTMKDVVAFRTADSTFQPVYFRNPGEKSINSKSFYEAIGGDDVVTVGLYQSGSNSPYIGTTNYLNRYKNKLLTGSSLLTSANAIKKQRDKRSEVITYFTATEASIVGSSKYIENYAVNMWGLRNCNKEFPSDISIDTFKVSDTVSIEKRINSYRKANHISEIDVLNPDGRRHVYGIPVYNLMQKEATFAVNASDGNNSTGFVKYTAGTDDSTTNAKGIDNYYNSQEIPAYAHSFLLTSILSPDYVDLTGDGISDDDLGDAVKFNYSKVAGIKNPYTWRAPYIDSATYNEGLKTDNRDDRGSYIYGEKEMWYMNSIESKTMIATFTLEDRKDQLPVNRLGQKDFTNNNNKGTKQLKEINLYSKADFLKKGTNATPIKTVHFEYSYELCKGFNKTAGNSYDTGKLTLKKLWFSYNGNNKGVKNPYRFFYNTNNPRYNAKSYDRWGNYKDPADNHAGLSNAEFPYAVQDSVKANTNAAAWTLDSIHLPSGGRIKAIYESDDYAYVQNKRAMQMFKILGLSTSPTATKVLNLYNTNHTDNLFVFVRSEKTLTSKKDVYYKYLEGMQKVYFKLNVRMPTDDWGNGSEYIPCYADIDSAYNNGGYDMVDANTFWVKLKGINLAGDQDGEYSPLAKAAIQFLRLNLPSKAYPGSEVSDGISVIDVVTMIFTMVPSIIEGLKSFDAVARENYMATAIDTNRTFIRLANPDFKRRGGGLRVKSIKIYDNWKAMTSSAQKEAVYGQEYDYTTTKEVNGQKITISSGVASYEPMIGSEENPFHLPMRFSGRAAPLGPVTLGYVEEPLGETFFPGADVGYSKVRVRSINTKNRKSANGYEETKFYTTYDFPTTVDNSMLDDNTKKRYKPKLANFLKINAKHYLTLSQGFKIELNDMNGKMRSQATYPATDSLNPISYTENFYKVDDQNAVVKHLANTVTVMDAQGTIDTTAIIGKDAELMMDMREQQSVTNGNNFNANVEVFVVVIIPIVIPSLWYLPQHEENLYRSVATTKVIQRYGILDSVIHMEKGSLVSTKNLVYDSETGDVLLTRTNNEFNDPVYNFTFPSHWAYSGMGMAYQNIDAVFNSVSINNGVPQYSSKYPAFKKYFESGDEILATGREKISEYTPFDCAGQQTTCAVNTYSSSYTTKKIWALNPQKTDTANTESLVFVDQDGKAYSAADITMKIVRSGKRNIGASPVGTVTCLKNPVQTVSGQLKLVLDSTVDVVASSALIFNDSWKIEPIKKSATIENSCCGPLKNLFDYLIASHRLFTLESAGITVDSIVRAANGSVNDCDLLSANANGLFYALTTDSVATTYRANFGQNIITIKADDFREIHYYSLESVSCGLDGKVYYQDNTRYLKRYSVHNSTGSILSYTFIDCESGHYGIQIQPGDDTCFFALPGKVFLSSGLDTTNSCTPGTQVCIDTTSIYLSVEQCSSCPSYACYDPIIDTSVNPYAYGIYGNWRSNKSYVYYGERIENDPASATNVRTNGVIKSFVPYWSFNNGSLRASSDTTRWVWNAESTLFNKKGYELENKDPLGRYNSGQYGYNQTLPVSVTQNSKYREQFFDGFEDYGFRSQNCSALCPTPRNIDFTADGGTLDTVYRHSGKYSLKINAGDSDIIAVPVVPERVDTVSQAIIADIDVNYIYDTIVNANGDGLQADLDGNSHPNRYMGEIQVEVSGTYIVTSNFTTVQYGGAPDAGYSLTINSILDATHNVTGGTLSVTVFLLAGEVYPISISCHSGNYFSSSFNLSWQRTAPCPISNISVDSKYLYDINSTSGTVIYDTSNCSKLNGIFTDSSSLVKTFAPTQGSKFWLSAWVKEDQDCLCKNFANNQIVFLFTDSSNTVTSDTAKPSGTIIEGWQRYDKVITIPGNTVSMSYKLMATDTVNVYFDDIRIHPYNANMKSFVYDPVSLRLMAELDENNYATYYEYDDDGTLIRVKKETQRGVQTIKETRSYLINQ